MAEEGQMQQQSANIANTGILDRIMTKGNVGNLNLTFYYGVVVGTKVDREHSGAVQAKILGVTDNWENDAQPWIMPQLGYGMQAVPQEGYYLLVRFLNGDINQGIYYGVSQSQNYMPAEYTMDYPFVAFANLGEHNFNYIHNRNTHITKIDNEGNGSHIMWDATGAINISSESYSSEEGDITLPVLTEGTIDIFTCKPVGHGESGILQGSEYLKVSHISAATINSFRNSGGQVQVLPQEDALMDGEETRDIMSETGSIIGKVSYLPAAQEAWAKRNGKTATHILICCTDGKPFAKKLADFSDNGCNAAPHFLVGLGGGTPDIIEGDNDKQLKNEGFVQFVEMDNDSNYGTNYKLDKMKKKKSNKDAIVVMFYGDGTLNDYQKAKLTEIVAHTKGYFSGLEENPPVYAYKSGFFDSNYSRLKAYAED